MSGITRSPTRLLAAAVAILAVTAVALAVSAYLGRSAATSLRSGDLRITKECSQFTGLANSFCTITSSNLEAVKVGSRIVSLQAAGKTSLDSDMIVVVGPGDYATGHCYLPFPAGPGHCKFSGGKGSFSRFNADLIVTPDASVPHGWFWNGTYRFDP